MQPQRLTPTRAISYDDGDAMPMTTVPSESEVLDYFDTLSNWGRWGPDDGLGTLNFVGDDKRVEAARLIHTGQAISCALDIGTDSQINDINGVPPQRYMVTSGEGVSQRDASSAISPDATRAVAALEYLGLIFHGVRVTHLDALSHVFWDGKMYNGMDSRLVSSLEGATVHAVTNARNGILTRAVLLDIARHRNVPWLEPGESVRRDEIEDFLAQTGTEVRDGDALLLRTGYPRLCQEKGPVDNYGVGRAGWHASCLPFFYEHNVALIGADTAQDARPSGYSVVRSPIHAVAIVAMGLWMLDNCNLELLSDACTENGTQAFAFSLAPMCFMGATGSPVNPIALF
jgi:kynurenine formamidase